ncbi:MAG: hypothetical protein JRD05_00755 [Deltaproteobacteria bacterium]|nr:hypothetical protein [Deltaproteobacteria bacterium]
MAGNTTPIHGKVCRTAKGTAGSGTNIDFTEAWNIDVSLDMADISRQGQHWKEALPGQAGWGGSFSGQLVLGNTEQKAIYDNLVTATPGTKLTGAAALAFHLEDTGDYLTGDVYITGVAISPGLGDKVAFSVNFQGTGALSLTAG